MKVRVELAEGRSLPVVLPNLAPGPPAEVEVGAGRLTAALILANGQELILDVNGRRYVFLVEKNEGGTIRLLHQNRRYLLQVESEIDELRRQAAPFKGGSQPVILYSMLPGVVRQVYLQPGSEVEPGTAILTLEAMKMENEIRSEVAGRLEEVHVKPGQVVAAREPLATIIPEN
ncbi:MAG: biotin attachment protein [Planctomycetes bacterium]|nr:biotin attachment protein [Planctomycetota bacterium]